MTLLDHNVDEFPRAYWTYSPRDLQKNHSFNRTVTNWGPCHDNKIEVLLFQRPSQNMEQKYLDIIWDYEQIWRVKQTNHAVVGHQLSHTRQYQNMSKDLQKKSASQKTNSHETSMSKKTYRIGAIFKFHGSTPETRNSFLNPKTMKAQKSNNQGLWIVFDVVIIPQERYFSSNAVAKTQTFSFSFCQIDDWFTLKLHCEILLDSIACVIHSEFSLSLVSEPWVDVWSEEQTLLEFVLKEQTPWALRSSSCICHLLCSKRMHLGWQNIDVLQRYMDVQKNTPVNGMMRLSQPALESI